MALSSRRSLLPAVVSLLGIFLTYVPPAAGQTIEWARQFGTNRVDEGFAVTLGPGSVYIAGETFGSFDGFTNAGNRDVFVSRYDLAGNHFWTKQFGSTASETATGVAADASGVYVVGNTFGAIPGQTSMGGEDAYVRKYDPEGNVLWTRQFGTSGEDSASAATSAAYIYQEASGFYVGGRTSGALPGQTSNSLGQDDGFLRKYNSAGDELWTRQFGTTSGDRVFGVAGDTSGVYVAGSTGGPLASPPQGTDAFVSKYNHEGMVLWTKQITSVSQNDIAYAVAVDTTGVFAVGDTTGTFAGQTKVGGLYDAWVRKFALDGDELWTKQFGTTGDDHAHGASTGAGWVYIAEFTNDRTLLQRFDLDGGTPSVLQLSRNRNFAYAVAANATAAYLAGSKDGDSLDQTPLGDLDALLLRVKHGESMITGVFDGANSLPVITPGGTFQAYFTPGTIPATMTSSTVPLSTDLGFSISVDGRLAALFGVFAGKGFDQVNGVVPWNTETGRQASFTFAVNGTPVKGSAPFAVDVAPAAPGIYTFQYGLGPAIVQNFSDASFALAPGSLGATPAHPAPIGGIIIIWSNGLGPISGPVPDGDVPAPGSPLLIPTEQVRLFIGGVQATILGTVLHPTLVSLFQMNAIVPPGVTPGNEVPIEIEIDFGGGNVFRSRDDVFIAVSAAP